MRLTREGMPSACERPGLLWPVVSLARFLPSTLEVPIARHQIITRRACGAGGLNFEEFVIFRCLVGASCLEDQFRFLWAVYDRNADGFFDEEELRHVLQAP
eukprot:4589366-Pleurochrysis_carterae.AAC.1